MEYDPEFDRTSEIEGRDPFNQNFRKFRPKTQWIGSNQPEKFRKKWSIFLGGSLFLVGPVGILVEWIAPKYLFQIIKATCKRTQQPPTFLAQQFWELLRPFAPGLTFDRFQTLHSNSQQHTTTYNNMQQGVKTDATSNIQQCWELLANNVTSVCTELKQKT